MENKNFENINYDYYSNTTSFLKTILDMLPENMVSVQMKQVVRELYNYYLNRFEKSERDEIAIVSAMFSKKGTLSNLDELNKYNEFLYENFIVKFVFDPDHRVEILYTMLNNIKVYVGYFAKRQEEFEMVYNIKKSQSR